MYVKRFFWLIIKPGCRMTSAARLSFTLVYRLPEHNHIKTSIVPLPKEHALEIDTLEDFEFAEFLLKKWERILFDDLKEHFIWT